MSFYTGAALSNLCFSDIGCGFLGTRSLNAIGNPFYCFGSLIGYLTALKPLERIEIT